MHASLTPFETSPKTKRNPIVVSKEESSAQHQPHQCEASSNVEAPLLEDSCPSSLASHLAPKIQQLHVHVLLPIVNTAPTLLPAFLLHVKCA